MLARVPSVRQKRFAELRRIDLVSSFRARHVRPAASINARLIALAHYSLRRAKTLDDCIGTSGLCRVPMASNPRRFDESPVTLKR
jgi:hypothetical protein